MDVWYARLGQVHGELVQAECADVGSREYVSSARLSALLDAAKQLAAAQPGARVQRSVDRCVPLWQRMTAAARRETDVVTLLSLRPATAVDSTEVVCVPSVTVDAATEWRQETRLLVEYAHKVWHGRFMARVVEQGSRLPHASLDQLVSLLEALPNFSAARDALFRDLPPWLKIKTPQGSSTVSELVGHALTPIYETLPPRYVPQREQVTQAMVNWWVAKLSRPTVKRAH